SFCQRTRAGRALARDELLLPSSIKPSSKLCCNESHDQCHEGQIFKEKYPQALAGIDLGTDGWRELPSEKVQENIGHDYSLTSAASLYMNEGHATAIYYGAFRERYAQKYGAANIPENQWIFEYFQRTSIVEALLIQKWILHILDAEVSVLPYNVGKLYKIKRNLIIALYEYHNDIFQ